MYRGDFTTISEAITAAKAGDKIVIRAGRYEEGLVIDKALEIEGEGDTDAVVIQAVGKDAILFRAPIGQVRNLTLRQQGGGSWFCVDIAQGRLLLEGCDISSPHWSCVAIYGGANPMIRSNRIHGSQVFGIFVSQQGQGIIQTNYIYANKFAGIGISDNSIPKVINNYLRNNQDGAWDIAEDCLPNITRQGNIES